MKKYKQKDIWLDYNLIFTKNRHLNFIIGPRGRGKTYGFLKWHFNRFWKQYKKGIIEQMIYMRTTKTELDETWQDIYNKVIPECFPDYEIKCVSFKYFARKKVEEGEEENEWVEIGRALPLSTAHKQKGVSYPYVKYLCYDEFLSEVGAYELKGIVHKFFNALETIFRMRNDFRVVLLGNATSFECDFKYILGLQQPFNSSFWYHPTKSILVHLADNPAYLEAKRESAVGKLVKDTDFESYALENKFYGDSTTFIRKKKGNYRLLATFSFNNKTFGIFYKNKYKDREIIIDSIKHNDLVDFIIKSPEMDSSIGNIIFTKENTIYNILKKYFNNNCLYYQNMYVKTQLHSLFLKML